MFLFTKCCGCIPLSWGCIIISAVELLINLSCLVLIGHGIFSSIGIFTEFMLVYGVAKRQRAYLWTWIAFNVVSIVLLDIAIIYCILALTGNADYLLLPDPAFRDAERDFIVTMTIILISIAAAFIFFTLIVYSHTCELREIEIRHEENIAHPTGLYLATDPV